MRGVPYGNWYVPGPDGRAAKHTADEHGTICDVATIHVAGLERGMHRGRISGTDIWPAPTQAGCIERKIMRLVGAARRD